MFIYITYIHIYTYYGTVWYSRSATMAVPEDRLRGWLRVCKKLPLAQLCSKHANPVKHSMHRIHTEKTNTRIIYIYIYISFVCFPIRNAMWSRIRTREAMPAQGLPGLSRMPSGSCSCGTWRGRRQSWRACLRRTLPQKTRYLIFFTFLLGL